LQTAYADEDLPSKIRVTYPPHALVGKDLKVVGRRRNGREFSWRVVLPDGSHADLPSSWTDRCAVPARVQAGQVKARASPKTLRELMHLLDSLASS
jgi:hypothetical protein